MSTPRAIFLDRDGVLNKAIVREGRPYAPTSCEEFEMMEDAPILLQRLVDAGYLLFGVTNQPDVARGKTPQHFVETIHQRLLQQLPIHSFWVCYHDDEDGCDCRKPLPGLLQRAAEQHTLNLSHCFMVGDRWRDVLAGQRAGCQTVFIDYDYTERKPDPPATYTVNRLSQAVDWILQQD
jgi:D-glycero-D-manno-heptose 1,7-bisphosphate phosphatase